MDAPATPLPTPMRSLVFVVTEDWFFASHFLPLARAGVAMGLSVAVVTRVRAHRAAIEATGARVVPLEAERSSLNPMAAGYAAGQLAAILKALKADPGRIATLERRNAELLGALEALVGNIAPMMDAYKDEADDTGAASVPVGEGQYVTMYTFGDLRRAIALLTKDG